MKNDAAILIIGLGNHYRKDDGVGLVVAENIKAQNYRGVKVIDGISDGMALLEAWSEVKKVYIVDAVISGVSPGTIYRFDALNGKIPAEIFTGYSTHSFNIVETIELAKTLNELPDLLIVYCIEGVDFEAGTGLTPELEKAAVNVSNMIKKEIEEYCN